MAERALSVAERALSVAERALSVTRVTERALSVGRNALCHWDGTRSVNDGAWRSALCQWQSALCQTSLTRTSVSGRAYRRACACARVCCARARAWRRVCLRGVVCDLHNTCTRDLHNTYDE